MDCLRCGIAFHVNWSKVVIRNATNEDQTSWMALVTRCPACLEETIRLKHLDARDLGGRDRTPLLDIIVYPKATNRKPTPKEVPPAIKEDYEEACLVLPSSNKASAALARRCLQALLRGQGYTQRDLAHQIDALLGEQDSAKAIPTELQEAVDAIRNFGNFSAHPVTDQTTLQIISVEPNEAEWCLEILEEMFDHYYVRPARVKARKSALDAKLQAAGKPRSK